MALLNGVVVTNEQARDIVLAARFSRREVSEAILVGCQCHVEAKGGMRFHPKCPVCMMADRVETLLDIAAGLY